MAPRLSHRRATLYGAFAALAVFAFDMVNPPGMAASMPYIVLPLVGLLSASARPVVVLALLATVLTIAGTLLTPHGLPLFVVLANRAMSVTMIWIVTLIAMRHLAIGESLRASLEKQATHDPLTELYNRRYVFSIIENELKRYRRYGDRFSLILIDADYFKRVNDTYGHGAGDAALRHISDSCIRSVREADVVGRFGGEEFIVVLPRTRATEAAVVAERIRATLRQPGFKWQDHPVNVTLSLGIAEVGPDTTSFDELLKSADKALYAAKRAGRDQVAIAASETHPAEAPIAA